MSNQPIEKFDEVEIGKFHWRMVFTAGMGFFTDAYDLFIIGVVTAILAPIWHLSVSQLALLNGASLIAAAVGAVIFSTLSDKFGRKKLYGFEVLILFIGAIFSAVAPNFVSLLIARVIVGLGIGGDYPTSAVVASESANRKNRGFLVLLVFAMQAVGLIVGPLLASIFLASGIPHNITWRILLGVGAIPAASVFYLRRKIKESPHYLLSKRLPLEVSRIVHDLAQRSNQSTQQSVGNKFYKPQKLFSGKWLKYLIGTASAWFLLDVAFYGNGISSVLILKHLSPNDSLLTHTIISALIFLVCAVPGYFVAAKYVDQIGRKTLQYLGFSIIAFTYFAMAFIPPVMKIVPIFIIIFGLSFFFVNFGPNTTTFLIPSEIFPTSIRARAHGLSAAVGKVGAFIGAFCLPLLMQWRGLHFTMAVMGFVALGGVVVTTLLPEMKGLPLSSTEQIEDDSKGTFMQCATEI